MVVGGVVTTGPTMTPPEMVIVAILEVKTVPSLYKARISKE